MTFLYYLFLFLFLFLAVLLCFFILIQESKSSGLGASFGGGGEGGESLFGTSTPHVLKKITAWLAVFFLAGCIILSLWTGTLGRAKTKAEVSTEIIER